MRKEEKCSDVAVFVHKVAVRMHRVNLMSVKNSSGICRGKIEKQYDTRTFYTGYIELDKQ